MVLRPPRSTLFPTRRSSDLVEPLIDRTADIARALAHVPAQLQTQAEILDRKSTRLNSSHRCISYAVFCLKKKNICSKTTQPTGQPVESRSTTTGQISSSIDT